VSTTVSTKDAAVKLGRSLKTPPDENQTDLEDALGGPKEENEAGWGNISAQRLRSLIERIERLEEERVALTSDIKDIFAEAKSAGFDVKVMRQLIKIRKMDSAEVNEQETLLDVYRRALGM
jgi:uncharacterized protein (UPF0335 family)